MDLSLEPTPATAQLMSHDKMRWHERSGTLNLYYRYSELPGQSINEWIQREGSKLNFRLKVNNPHFFGITALPEKWSGQPVSFNECGFYLHNRATTEDDNEWIISGCPANERQVKFAQMSQAASEPLVDQHLSVGDLYWRLEAIPSWVELPIPDGEEGQEVSLNVAIKSPEEEKEQSSNEKRYQTTSQKLVPLLEQPTNGQHPTLQIANFPALADEITLPLPNYQNIRAERTETEPTTDKPTSQQLTYFADTYVYL